MQSTTYIRVVYLRSIPCAHVIDLNPCQRAAIFLLRFLASVSSRPSQPPKVQQKSKEQKMAAAMAGGKSKKKVSYMH